MELNQSTYMHKYEMHMKKAAVETKSVCFLRILTKKGPGVGRLLIPASPNPPRKNKGGGGCKLHKEQTKHWEVMLHCSSWQLYGHLHRAVSRSVCVLGGGGGGGGGRLNPLFEKILLFPYWPGWTTPLRATPPPFFFIPHLFYRDDPSFEKSTYTALLPR